MAPWNGSGIFNTAVTFVPNTNATAEDQNTQDNDIASGITNALAKDGQNSAIANINMGGNKLTNLANGSSPTDGAAFGQLGSLLPSGMIMPFAGTGAIPTGYLLCNGQAVSRITYASLYTAVGNTYGAGDGVTTFNVPNLLGRVIAGVDPTGTVLTTASINTPATPGGIGGTESVALTTAQLAAHNHGVNDPGHAHNYTIDNLVGPSLMGTGGVPAFGVASTGTGTTSSNGTGIAIQNAGSGAGHLNVQPTMVMNYLIKT